MKVKKLLSFYPKTIDLLVAILCPKSSTVMKINSRNFLTNTRLPMAAEGYEEQGSGPWETIMKGNHCLSLRSYAGKVLQGETGALLRRTCWIAKP